MTGVMQDGWRGVEQKVEGRWSLNFVRLFRHFAHGNTETRNTKHDILFFRFGVFVRTVYTRILLRLGSQFRILYELRTYTVHTVMTLGRVHALA